MIVAAVRNPEVALGVERQRGRVVEGQAGAAIERPDDFGDLWRQRVGRSHGQRRGERRQQPECLQATTGILCHVRVALPVEGEPEWAVELPRLGTGATPGSDQLASGRENLDPIGAVGDEDPTFSIDCDIGRTAERLAAVTCSPPGQLRFTIRRKPLHAAAAVLGDPQIAGAIEGDPGRPGQLPGFAAPPAPCSQPPAVSIKDLDRRRTVVTD